MRIITAPEEYIIADNEISIFLAGGITNCPDWQSEIIKRLEHLFTLEQAEDVVIFNPRRENFPIDNPGEAYTQILWEFKALEKCDIFSMYFSSGDSDQPICMYELGRNIVKMQMKYPNDWEKRIIVSIDKDYKRFKDANIQTQLACGDRKIGLNLQYFEDALKENHAQYICRAWRKIKYNR